MAKLTKQGVRDLNHLPGKTVGEKLEVPPIVIDCKCPSNRRVQIFSGDTLCKDCGKMWDWNGKSYQE